MVTAKTAVKAHWMQTEFVHLCTTPGLVRSVDRES